MIINYKDGDITCIVDSTIQSAVISGDVCKIYVEAIGHTSHTISRSTGEATDVKEEHFDELIDKLKVMIK